MSQERLRAAAAELNLSEQRERQKLASDLHDYLAQLLSLMRIKLDLTKHHAKGEELAKLFADLQELISKALEYTRTLITQLCPPGLRELGLDMALQALAEQMQERGLNVVFQAAPIPSVPEDQGLLLFQSVRELLLNCVRYAGVRRATLALAYLNRSLHITVSDQGEGFDAEAVNASLSADSTARRGFGLVSIRERMHSLGGRFDLHTAPGKGTVATLVLPIKNMAESAARPDQMSNALHRQTAMNEHQNGMRLRVLVADDHAIVRQGISGLLSTYDDIEVVGEAANGEEAVEMGKGLRPDVFVMDINMPKLDGIEATRRIKKQQPTAIVIGLSISNSSQIKETMKHAGAIDVLNKETEFEQLYETIRTLRP